MSDAKGEFEKIAGTLLSVPFVTCKSMFGLPSLFVSGRVFASLDGEEMVFKLPAVSLNQALSLPGAHRFDPMGRGRMMKEWISVPRQHASRWEELAQSALAYVANLNG